MILTKHFGSKCVLNKKEIDIQRGKRYLFWGKSGIGKTTAMRILAGLESNEESDLLNLGKISMVFQEDRLLESFSAKENLLVVCSNINRVNKYLKAFGIPAEQRVREFSGGMKRRVAILRALISTHDSLFMDEPFTGLDDETYAMVINFINEKEKGKTIVVISHEERTFKDLYIDEIVEF